MRKTSILGSIATIPASAVLFGAVLACATGCDNDPTAGKTQATTTAPAPEEGRPMPQGAERIEFDQTSGKVEFVGAKVTGKHDGGFEKFSGTIELAKDALEKSTVKVTIDTTSIFTDHPKLTKHLSGEDFFAVAEFPTAKFVSTKIVQGGVGGATHTITGNLTLHGVAKSITFPAKISSGSDAVKISAEFGINRKDFGIVYAGKPDDLIKDEVLIKLALSPKKS